MDSIPEIVETLESGKRRAIKFILPILSPEKPKRLSITMANTLFGAMSGVWLVNWGGLIQEYVENSLPHIGRKPSFAFPLHPPSLPATWLHQRSGGGHVAYCGGQSRVQARSGNQDYESQNRKLKWHCSPRATSRFTHSEISEASLTSATLGSRTETGTPLHQIGRLVLDED